MPESREPFKICNKSNVKKLQTFVFRKLLGRISSEHVDGLRCCTISSRSLNSLQLITDIKTIIYAEGDKVVISLLGANT